MWLRSIYLKTLRDYRVAILGWGLGMGALVAVVLLVGPDQIGPATARNALVSIARQFTWYAEPVSITTLGGYTTWRAGPLLILVCIWALLAGSGTLRGEEERGALDVLLSVPRSRGRIALEKVAALGTALLAMGLLIALLTLAGGAAVHAPFGMGAALLFGLNVALLGSVFAALALLLAQFTRERGTAAGLAGGLLALSYVLDSTGRVVPGGENIGRFSPIYYFGLSKPLVASYGANAGALLALAGLAVALAGAGIWLFLRRDLGAAVRVPVWLRPPARAERSTAAPPLGAWSLRSVYTRSLRTLAVPTFWWGLGSAAFAGWMTSLARQLEQNLVDLYKGSPFFSQVVANLSGGNSATNAGFLSVVFVYLPILVTAFAVTQANQWAADEENGRLELLLATPQARPAVILTRFAALTTAVLVIAGLLEAAVAWAAYASGLSLDGGHLTAAMFGMAPLALVVAATGYLLAGWLRTAAVTGLLSLLLIASFVVSFLGPAFNWPDAVLQLSLFQQYGTPLVSGLRLPNTLGVLAVAAAALALATVRFARKDIGR